MKKDLIEKYLAEDNKSQAAAKLIPVLKMYEKATFELLSAWDKAQSSGLDDPDWALEKLPFTVSFDELALDVKKWVETCTKSLSNIK